MTHGTTEVETERTLTPRELFIQNLENRFTYHTPKEGQHEACEQLRNKAKELALLINELCPEGREKAFSFTNLEQSVFWANAAITRS